MKKLLLLALCIGLTGCSLFSNYKTVYRIETTTGDRYYSEDGIDLNSSREVFEIEDLDGNEYKIERQFIYKVEKFRHRK